jgi:hypothetical protein
MQRMAGLDKRNLDERVARLLVAAHEHRSQQLGLPSGPALPRCLLALRPERPPALPWWDAILAAFMWICRCLGENVIADWSTASR